MRPLIEGDILATPPGDSGRWPIRSRTVQTQFFDSSIWDDFEFRPDDIFIVSYPKSGSTWMQQIVAQILFRGAADANVASLSPCVDLRLPPRAEKLAMLRAQTHRRFIKSHLPSDAIVYSPLARYIFVARDGRDVVWSMHNHFGRANDLHYHAFNDAPGRVGPPVVRPPESIRQYFLEWLQGDGYPLLPFWHMIRSWWEIRSLPNVFLVHYQELKDDLEGSMRRVAEFLSVPVAQADWPRLVAHCRFDYMKQHGEQVAPLGGALWDGGAQTFIHRGTNGRWSSVLTPSDCSAYETAARRELGDPCAQWLAAGEHGMAWPPELRCGLRPHDPGDSGTSS